jgi:spore maturation protein CgeB
MRILALGPLWRGSNAGGLFRALSRAGYLIEVIDEFYYVSLQTRTKFNKVLERVMRPLQIEEHNRAILKKAEVFQPDIVFVYKGAFVKPETIAQIKKQNCKAVLFYPDVSMTAHGNNIPRSIPLYDLIFTTKTFGIRDLESTYGVKNSFFVPHGYDPEIHRPIRITEKEYGIFGCDASFIGTWSPKKEKWLAHLKEHIPGIDLKIWGEQWFKAASPILEGSIMGRAVLGDLYSMAIQASKINLGILSERVSGSSSGDLITSRTFHITGAAGFLLHERNEESVLYYHENEEAGFFDGVEELVSKVKEFLGDDVRRERIRLAGCERSRADHSLDNRAGIVIEHFRKLLA